MNHRNIQGDPLTILLIEDNFSHAELVKRSFQQHRLANRIEHVVDGQQALDYLLVSDDPAKLEACPPPHCILLDLRLPKIDGLEVLRIIKTTPKTEKIPVIVLSTSSAEQDVAKAYKYHANSYVVKPMDFEKFSELMDDLGFYWMAWNQSPWV